MVSFLGESKQGYYDKDVLQYQWNCPSCAEEKGDIDNKFNLETNFGLGKCHCWSCGFMGPISRLVKEYGGSILLGQYYDAINELKELKYLDISLFQNDYKGILDDTREVVLPKTFTKINLSTNRNFWLTEYLKSRKITQDIIDYYNIGYTKWDGEINKYRNRVIVPSYDSFGRLNYWCGRDYTGKSTFKYWNADKDCGAGKKTEIIFNEDKIIYDADIVLVEGIFDSLYYYNAIPLCGKVLKENFLLYERLFEKANANIIICLDADTEIEETKEIYKLLNHDRLKGKIWYIRLERYKDFGEIYEADGKKGIINTLKEKKRFNEIDLI